jgi:hypothetical protein
MIVAADAQLFAAAIFAISIFRRLRFHFFAPFRLPYYAAIIIFDIFAACHYFRCHILPLRHSSAIFIILIALFISFLAFHFR